MSAACRPWRCLNCKTPVSDELEECWKCGDRLKRRGTAREPKLNPTIPLPASTPMDIRSISHG